MERILNTLYSIEVHRNGKSKPGHVPDAGIAGLF